MDHMWVLQQERQRQLQAELESRGLKVSDGFLAAQRHIQGLAGGSGGMAGPPHTLEEAVAAIERRRFIAAHCSPERALALAGCQWAAQEMEQKVVNCFCAATGQCLMRMFALGVQIKSITAAGSLTSSCI